MAKTEQRPAIIDEFIANKKQMRKLEAVEKKLRPKILEIVRSSEYEDIVLQVQKTPQINEDLATEWAYSNLTKDQYKSLFVRQFDPNKFSDLCKQGTIDPEDLPDGLLFDKIVEKVIVK